MAYREAAPEETRRFSALFVPWRGVVSAVLIGAAATVPLVVVGMSSLALSGPLAFFSAFLAWRTWQQIARLTVEITRAELRVRVRDEERSFARSSIAGLWVRARPASGVLGLLPGPRPTARGVFVRERDGQHDVFARAILAGRKLDAFVATLAEALDVERLPPDVGEGPVDDTKRALVWLAHVIAAVSGLGFGLEAIANQHTGELTITCEERCAFQGMECLPGGEVRMRLDPGFVTVELGEPGARRALVVEVREGHRTELVCRADATTPTPRPEAR
ncbi:MAG: hypothetical protein R3B99_12855 [Polyangiales bacterium]